MMRKIFAEFTGKSNISLTAMCETLLARQKIDWPELAAACEALENTRRRTVSCGGYNVAVQFNPRRAASSGAAVDEESVRRRPCFLCDENRPPEQQAVLYQRKYLILCNPAPIFERHFTIAASGHQPQEITSAITDLLEITRDLSPAYVVFYNGSACGASAPDHLHFQACPAENFPFLHAISSLPPARELSPGQIYLPANTDRTVLMMEAKNSRRAAEQFLQLLIRVRKTLNTSSEPMINLVGNGSGGRMKLTVFLRGKHRPEAYFASGEKRVFISPGAVDMAGVIITPQERDFNRLDEKTIRALYREVSLPDETMETIINAL